MYNYFHRIIIRFTISFVFIITYFISATATVKSSYTWTDICQQGLLYQYKQDYDNAESIWKQQLTNYTINKSCCSYIRTLYGILLLSRGQIEKSITYLEQSLQDYPNDYITYSYLGINHEYLVRKYSAHRNKLLLSSKSKSLSTPSAYSQGYQFLLHETIRYLQLSIDYYKDYYIHHDDPINLPHHLFELSLHTIYRTLGTSIQWLNTSINYYKSLQLYQDIIYVNPPPSTKTNKLEWIQYWSRPTYWYSYHHIYYHSIGIAYYHNLIDNKYIYINNENQLIINSTLVNITNTNTIVSMDYFYPYKGYDNEYSSPNKKLSFTKLQSILTTNYIYRPYYFKIDKGFTSLLTKLEKMLPIIQHEFYQLYDIQHSSQSITNTPNTNNISLLFRDEEAGLQDNSSWNIYNLIINSKLQAKQCLYTPLLCQFLQSEVPEVFINQGQVKFSIMKNNTYVKPHVGPTNNRLRIHCSILLLNNQGYDNHHNNNTWIRIGPLFYTWQPGECFAFDESYEHEVGIGITKEENQHIWNRCNTEEYGKKLCQYQWMKNRISTTNGTKSMEQMVVNNDNTDNKETSNQYKQKNIRVILILDIANPFVNYEQYSQQIFPSDVWNKHKEYLTNWWKVVNE